MAPDLPNTKRDPKTLQFVPKTKGDKPKILDLMDKANILGMVTYENDILLIYEGQYLSTWLLVVLTRFQTLVASWTTSASPPVLVIT